MKNPVPRLDERFSDPGAQATPWATTREALETAQPFWLTTVRSDGRPHVTPLVAVWLDDALHFSTGPGEQEARNLAANSDVVLTTGCNRWDQGLDVMVEGPARRVIDRAVLERLATAWAAKWNGQWRYEVTDTGGQSSTRITLRVRGEDHTSSHDGICPVEALTAALAAQAIRIEVLELHQTNIGQGNDSEALTIIEYRHGGGVAWAAGQAGSVLAASMAAVIGAADASEREMALTRS